MLETQVVVNDGIDNLDKRNPTATPAGDHFHPSVRMLHIRKLEKGSCGFDLSRSKWDPYPWVSGVDKESPAELTGLRVGDCVLEVNGEDVLGMRIIEIAALVRSKPEHVTLLLWSTGMEPTCNPESLCCGPMPLNMERLSTCMATILAALECPICLDTIPPPTIQCQNGHLVCAKCRIRSEKCPVCREKYSAGRSLIAERVYDSLTDAFSLREDAEGKLRERLFGPNSQRIPAKQQTNINSASRSPSSIGKPVQSHTHKFLAKIMGKASSVDSLTIMNGNSISGSTNINSDTSGMLKTKSLSLSTSEIFRSTDIPISVIRCPSANRLTADAASHVLGTRRPRSCDTSTENVHLAVPPMVAEEQCYGCPCGSDCEEKLKGTELRRHVSGTHKMPLICFDTATAEIALPPRAPVENACLLLELEGYEFWTKLIVHENGDLFMAALLKGTAEITNCYILEATVRNSNSSGIVQNELIARSSVQSLRSVCWKDVSCDRKGIVFKQASLQSTFYEQAILLTVAIKRISDYA